MPSHADLTLRLAADSRYNAGEVGTVKATITNLGPDVASTAAVPMVPACAVSVTRVCKGGRHVIAEQGEVRQMQSIPAGVDADRVLARIAKGRLRVPVRICAIDILEASELPMLRDVR